MRFRRDLHPGGVPHSASPRGACRHLFGGAWLDRIRAPSCAAGSACPHAVDLPVTIGAFRHAARLGSIRAGCFLELQAPADHRGRPPQARPAPSAALAGKRTDYLHIRELADERLLAANGRAFRPTVAMAAEGTVPGRSDLAAAPQASAGASTGVLPRQPQHRLVEEQASALPAWKALGFHRAPG